MGWSKGMKTKAPKPMPTAIPFNKWSLGRIIEGRKICTSRNKIYNDPRVYLILQLPLCIVRDYLWKEEGADSPEEFEKVWRGIHRGRFEPMKMVYVHFGDFSDDEIAASASPPRNDGEKT
jgi:hypothetical protein